MRIDEFYEEKKNMRREGGKCEAVCTKVLHDLWLLLKSVPGPGGGASQSSSQSHSQQEEVFHSGSQEGALHSGRL